MVQSMFTCHVNMRLYNAKLRSFWPHHVDISDIRTTTDASVVSERKQSSWLHRGRC